MIPSVLHFTWSGSRFPAVFALAVRSASHHHPGWPIIVHATSPPQGSDAWDELSRFAEIRPTNPDAVLESVPSIGSRLVELHRAVPLTYPAGRSNLVRLAVLFTEGGWYLDFDTLVLGSLEPLGSDAEAVVGEEWVWRHDQQRVTRGLRSWMVPSLAAFGLSWTLARAGLAADTAVESFLRRLWGRRELNNAVLACVPGNPWFLRLLELALGQEPTIRFALGPALVNLGWQDPGQAERPLRLPPELFYQFPPSQTIRYFRGCYRLPPEAKVIHWCSSNHRRLLPQLDERWIRDHRGRSVWAAAANRILEAGQDPWSR